MELKIQLFNGFAAWRDGVPLRYEQSVQEHKLLACLLLHQGKPVSRDWLASVLWPDSDEANAKRNLRAVLSRLRDTLGLALPAVKEHDAKSLLFDSSLLSTSVEVDVYDFEAAYGAGRWRQAVEAYQGTLLKGWYEDWFLGQEQEYHDKYGLALTKAAENAAEAGRPQDALYYASRGLEDEHLLQEDFLDLKMRLLAESGRVSDLRTTYRNYRLKQEKGLDVSPTLERLYEKYALQASANSAQTRAVSHETKSYVWEAPAPILGRERETQEVAAFLKRGRLVTLTGAGGVGKTRLARHVLERIHASYPDSALFLELSEVTEPTLLWSHLAKMFGLPDSPRVAEESVLRYLHPRELLLALDNCEPMVKAVSKMAHTILIRCPNIRIIATSRVPLENPAEQQYPILPLPLPEVGSPDLETLAKVDSIALFVERASAVQSDFALTSQTVSAVVDLCHFTGGMPLFIEVLAKRSKYRSVVEMSSEIADNAHGLWRELGAGASQTLNAYREYVKSCVLPEHASIVSLLAAFPTGFDEAMAEFAIRACSVSPLSALELIEELDRKGLLVITHSTARKRFRFPEPIRLFLLPSTQEERAIIDERLIGWGHDFLVRREGWFDSSKRVEWFQDIEREFGNLCATLTAQPSGQADRVKGLAIAENLFPYWWRRGLHTLGRDYLQRTIQNAEGLPDCIEVGRALIVCAILTRHSGEPEAAQNMLERGASITTLLKDDFGRANALLTKGTWAYEAADFPTNCALLEEALGYAEQIKRPAFTALILNNLANSKVKLARFKEARADYSRSLAIRRDIGDAVDIGQTLTNMGDFSFHTGNYLLAERYWKECQELYRASGEPHHLSIVLHNIGCNEYTAQRFSEAKMALEEALEIRRNFRYPFGLISSAYQLAMTLYFQKEYGLALSSLREACHLGRELRAETLVSSAIDAAGLLLAREGSLEDAVWLWGVADALYPGEVGPENDYVAFEAAEFRSWREAVRTQMSEERYEACFSKGNADLQTKDYVEVLDLVMALI